jgi:MFS family permease
VIEEERAADEAAAGSPDGATPGQLLRRNPWWIPPFLGRIPELPASKLSMLGAVALALYFEQYDQAVLTAALKQIAETFGVAKSDLGDVLGWVHLGAIPAFLLVPYADRIGRRRLFLISVVGLSVAASLTAFSQSIGQFIAIQMVQRTFMVTCVATAFVIITEEFPAEHRGWGIGILGALGAFGYGLALLLFAAVAWLPGGWRALYVVGAAPLLLLPRLRRRVPETQRFIDHRAARTARGAPEEAWWRPLWSLLRTYPGRALAVGLIGALGSAGFAVGFSFSAYHVQDELGWEPWQYTAMMFAAGLVGIIGHPWAGRMADRRGRRAVGFTLFAAYPLLALVFYHGSGWALPFVWVPLIFAMTGGNTIQRAFSTELFPTSQRGTSSGWLQLTEAMGRVVGFAAVSWGTAAGASNTPMISIVVFATAIAALVVLTLPETGRRELEEVSAER